MNWGRFGGRGSVVWSEGSDDWEMSRFKWERGEGLKISEEVFSGKRGDEVV